MSSELRLAWVGVGHIHTPGFVNEVLGRGIKCAGVYDDDAERAAKNAEKLGGPVLTLAEIAQVDADGWVITSETVRHLDLLRPIVKPGRKIFVEKPLGTDAAQSRAITAAIEDGQAIFQTGYRMRGDSRVRTLKTFLDEGRFGTVTRARMSVCHNGALGGWFDNEWRWMADRSQSGVGAYGDLGTHGLDLLMWLFGDVDAATGALGMGTARYPGCDEFGEGLMQFASGVIGTLAASWDDVADPIRLQICGTKGHALLNGDLQVAGEDGRLEVVTDLVPEAPAGFSAFLDCVQGLDAELVTPRAATARDVVMDAIYRGAETRTWIAL
ncbi:MAG: Gfo/Idh/MocA family oxidoreductase [Fimbriimonadaceae bacterium]|nr:Gfo/Idh/MocA family oxidoreductase [Fimbriimonadaceae bacterium]